MCKYWCVNFDGETSLSCKKPKDFILQYGLEKRLWLMHYQYHHQKKGLTTTNWNQAVKPKPGDWLVAYLSVSTFYAIGEVARTDIHRERHKDKPVRKDTIARTTSKKKHICNDGIVEYNDSNAMYEDFTDKWRTPLDSRCNKVWEYPQRIDVDEWKYVVRNGVKVDGIINKDNFPMCLRAVFNIPEDDFKKVRKALQAHQGGK